MSGICGIIGLGSRPPPLDPFERMMQSMQHLGPDGSSRWHDSSIMLGHQMMHVTPESLDERLPLHHVPSQIALTSDARLDNREELISLLDMQASPPLPDSALLLAAYQKWGTGCASKLVGEFAFAVWNARERSLHCITDPMGVRPLFYREVPGKYFAFASEVVPLLAVEPHRDSVNQTRLAMLGVSALSVYLLPEATCFENVHRVPAASVLSVTGGRKHSTEYWTPDPGMRLHFQSHDECREAFQEVFLKAVKARMRSAFPVASLLSGGLDSSAIVGAASRLLKGENRKLITLSAVPMPRAEGRVTSEQKYIDLFRGYDNLEMYDVPAPGCGPFDDLEHLVESASLCSYSYQHFLYTALVRKAREKGARVILDGDGGEISASCYPRGYMAELLLTGKWSTLLKELGQRNRGHRTVLTVIKAQLARPLLPYAVLKALNRHNRFDFMIDYPIQADYVHDVLGRNADQVRDQILRLPKEYPNHRRNMAEDLLLVRKDLRQRSHAGFVDYQLAGFSYPFIDKRVLEFSLAVDGRFKYRDGRSRQLLRLGTEGLLPPEIRSRTSKVPFSADYHLRYLEQKDMAFSLLERFRLSGQLSGIVDFERAIAALENPPDYRANNPMRVDLDPQFTIPYALNLCYFLARFSNG